MLSIDFLVFVDWTYLAVNAPMHQIVLNEWGFMVRHISTLQRTLGMFEAVRLQLLSRAGVYNVNCSKLGFKEVFAENSKLEKE